jgi:hypothetical protein
MKRTKNKKYSKKYSKKSNYKRNKRNTTRRKRKKTRKRYKRGGSTVALTDVTQSQLEQMQGIPPSKTESATRVTETLDNPEEIERYVLEKLVPQYNALSPEKRDSIFIASLLYSHQFDGFHNRLIRNYHNGMVVHISLFDKTLLQSSEELTIFKVKGTFKYERLSFVEEVDRVTELLKATQNTVIRGAPARFNRYARQQVADIRADLIIAEKKLERYDGPVGPIEELKSDEFPFIEDCLVQNRSLNREIEIAKESDNKPLFCVQKCSFLHKHMKDNSLVLDRSITVYRGILLGKTTQYLEGGFNNELTGFSSTTYKMTQAISYLIGHRLPSEFEDEEYDSDKLKAGLSKMIILKIKLNPGTHVFYTDMCGKDETELTLLDEGSLNMGTETYIEVSKDQFLKDIGIAGEYTGEDSSFPSISLKQIECEFVPNPEQINYSEVLFDPLSRLMV